MHGDTALILEVLENLSFNFKHESNILTQNAVHIKLAQVNIIEFCKNELKVSDFYSEPINWLKSLHAYILLYILIPFVWILGALNLIAILNTVTFLIIPIVGYCYCRSNNKSISLSFFSTLAIILHPAWQIAIFGQFYIDRIFIPISLIYALLLYQYSIKYHLKKGYSKYTLQLLFIIGASISERYALIISIYTILFIYSIGYHKNLKIFIYYSILTFIYSVIYTKIFNSNFDNVDNINRIFKLSSIFNSIFIKSTFEYIFFNIIYIAPIIILKRKLLIPTLMVVLINIFITIGGAEKNGWLTHYHSHYYGFLVAGFLISINSYKNYLDCKIIKYYLLVTTILILYANISLYKDIIFSNKLINFYAKNTENSTIKYGNSTLDKLFEKIPVGSSITMNEWGLPKAYINGYRDVSLYPVNIGYSDYIITSVSRLNGVDTGNSAVRYKPDLVEANQCSFLKVRSGYSEIFRVGDLSLYRKDN